MTDDRLQTREQMVERTAAEVELAKLKEALDQSKWHHVNGEQMKRILVAESALHRIAAALAAAPTPRGEEVLSGLRNLRAQFERIAAHHPNEQPAYPNGVRPWGTGDLRHNIETLEAAIAALSTPRAEIDDDARALCERLREQFDSGLRTIGGGNISSDGKCETWGGEPIMRPANRDGEAAAAMIERLALAAATPAPAVGDGRVLCDACGEYSHDCSCYDPSAVPGAISIPPEVDAALCEALRSSQTIIALPPIDRVAVLQAVERNWNAGPDALADAIVALAATPASVTPDAGERDDRFRFGSPPEPVVNPNEAWCERYADWYYQGKG